MGSRGLIGGGADAWLQAADCLTQPLTASWCALPLPPPQEFPAKLRSDFKRTMLNGWKFWVPAATINFVAVPLQYQVGPAVPTHLQLQAFESTQSACACAQLLAAGRGSAWHLCTTPLPPGPALQVLYMSTCGMCWTGYLSYQAAAKSS